MGDTARGQLASTDVVTNRLVTDVARREGVDPTDLPESLYSAVDTDALETLLSGETGTAVRVEFVYCGYHVTIERDGGVRIDVE